MEQKPKLINKLGLIYKCDNCETGVLIVRTGEPSKELSCCNKPMRLHKLVSEAPKRILRDQ